MPAATTEIAEKTAITGIEIPEVEMTDKEIERSLHAPTCAEIDFFVGQAFEKFRLRSDISLEDLAAAVNLPKMMIQEFEIGFVHMPLGKIQEMCSILKIAPHRILPVCFFQDGVAEPVLRPREQRIVECFRELPATMQNYIENVVINMHAKNTFSTKTYPKDWL